MLHESPRLDVTITECWRHIEIEIKGKLALPNLAAFTGKIRKVLIQREKNEKQTIDIVLFVPDLTWIDSSGIATIVNLNRHHAPVLLCEPRGDVLEKFTMLGLHGYITIYKDQEDLFKDPRYLRLTGQFWE